MHQTDERGFTIMELLVAIAFIGVVLVSLTNLFIGLRQINRAANNYMIAVEVAQQYMEKYRNTSYSSITTGTTDVTTAALGAYPSLLSPRTATTTVVFVDTSGVTQGYDTGIKKVDMAISYKDRTGTRQVQFSTQIAELGLNR
jgi:prepilin-type N-terminal cleavage/methylation domain-containing protein